MYSHAPAIAAGVGVGVGDTVDELEIADVVKVTVESDEITSGTSACADESDTTGELAILMLYPGRRPQRQLHGMRAWTPTMHITANIVRARPKWDTIRSRIMFRIVRLAECVLKLQG